MESIPITKQLDQAVYNTFKLIYEQFDQNIKSISVHTIPGPSFSDVFESNLLEELLEHRSTLIRQFTISFPGFNIIYFRGGNRKEKSPFVDEIHLGHPSSVSNREECPLSDSEKLSIAALLAEKFESIDPKRAIKGALSEEQHELLSIHQETLSRLEYLNEEMIGRSQIFRENLESEYERKKKALEEFSEKNLAKKLAELQSQKEILESKIKNIDDRDNTHVRRQLRQNILEEIKRRSNEFKLTKGTNRLRWPIHIACIVVTAIFASGAWFYGKDILAYLDNDNFNLTAFSILTMKQFAFTIASGGTAIFYIKWLNRWFEEHSTTEFNIKQFQLDIERSSWIVETILEWNEEKNHEIPPELLNQLTKNLFEYDKTQKEPIKHPADHLASALLGSASNVNLKAGDAQINFTGRQLKKNMSSN